MKVSHCMVDASLPLLCSTIHSSNKH